MVRPLLFFLALAWAEETCTAPEAAAKTDRILLQAQGAITKSTTETEGGWLWILEDAGEWFWQHFFNATNATNATNGWHSNRSGLNQVSLLGLDSETTAKVKTALELTDMISVGVLVLVMLLAFYLLVMNKDEEKTIEKSFRTIEGNAEKEAGKLGYSNRSSANGYGPYAGRKAQESCC
mmetsp:Transcript_22217/g.40029  ORF Transcript_22217/g.40029 Transcript_22217/m.40029 type:complete len:179 (+) Transcript_22217:68-604(+)|eukprot:CAMPEP_0197649504 /NCGR_PEP_ID=MMETSP1338-20131121/28586_1 /TAXON_ID=43686 ORGANISM="Pelagodinium beii, Strain RCC1491" /NCGR_SAMPLE_ID=MMETSP1338 /ASSEMBLY_ACC=CAM_ASM_000754 /LENGTH=178 /DNA_ID=CAMNT_0043223703 /DNA_START=68 /DNA_END=604 /DNA_ORIENTATION=+